MKNIFNMIDNIPQLRWACRRGMLELDILLGNYLNEAYSELPIEEKSIFIQLLEYSDPELFAWLMGSDQPQEAPLAKMVAAIRAHAAARI